VLASSILVVFFRSGSGDPQIFTFEAAMKTFNDARFIVSSGRVVPNNYDPSLAVGNFEELNSAARMSTPVEFLNSPRRDWTYRILKRSYDLGVASVALLLLVPFFIVFAALIKLGSPGPVFFRQDRYGLNGELFSIFKFRTMAQDSGDVTGIEQTVANDPRVTPVGRILRKTSFDELPQIFNILKGDMSVVGPRPHVAGMLANGVDYEEFDSRYMSRHVVRPGLTGLAQISGFRGETSTEHSARMRLEYDLRYIRDQSILLDIKVTAKTFLNEFIGGTGY
jgi:lipopolysaccharide/colanic/teichoic acid biosynthesis glycosyltransferase